MRWFGFCQFYYNYRSSRSYLNHRIRYFNFWGMSAGCDHVYQTYAIAVPSGMDITSERTYPTPYANSAILPLLLLSLSSQRITPKVTKNIDTEYDYIIVGGGTAGSVVASRLSELPCVNVLLLEAGKDPPLLTEVPALSKFFKFTDIDWNYKTVPQKHTGEALLNKQIPLSSGKTLGGSSVISSMVTIRGKPSDYDQWANQGADGWSYEDVISYFKKLEDNKDPEYRKNGFHSTGGLLTVHRPRYQSEVKKPLFQAARSIGYKVVDPNALKQTGFYDFQASLRQSQRCSASKAYLIPAENRTNLHILSKATVRKIVIQNGVASGVLYDYEGEIIEVKSRKEVILSAGTFNSAQLLMLSGIGPKKHLEELKIPVIADLPVGQNLQDHCALPLHFALNSSIPSILMKLINPANVDQYIKTRNGVLSSADFITALGFQNGDELSANKDSPSFQLYVAEDTSIIPKLHYGLKPEVYSKVFGKYENKAYITCFSVTLHPRSRGTVKLQSSNPYDPPLIDPNYLEHPNDVKDVVEGLKTCMRLARTAEMQKLGTVPFETFYPGCSEYKKKEDLYFWCLAKQVALSMNNAVGTAKMGRIEDATTVVDSQLRVKHVKGLRVIDASVMPTITSGDTNLPTVMIAERASDILKSTVDCDDLIAESEVQASMPVISISRDYLEDLPKILKPPLLRRNDNNLSLEQLKEAFSLYNRDKEAYHKSVTDKLQSRIKDLSYALEDLTPNKRTDNVQSRIKGLSYALEDLTPNKRTDNLQSRIKDLRHALDDLTPDTRRGSSSSPRVDDLIRCLEELKYQLQNQNHREDENSRSYGRNRGSSDMLVNQILATLASTTQKNNPSHNRNVASHDEVPPAVMYQILSILEHLKEDRDSSETSSRRSVHLNSHSLPIDAINQVLSVLNNAKTEEIHTHTQFIDSSSGNEGNSQNVLLNQVFSALQVAPQTNNPVTIQHQNVNNTPIDTTQITIQNQLNQILATINELKQGPTVLQNETTPHSTHSNATNNSTDKTHEMMHQILSAINNIKQPSQINATESITTPTPVSQDNHHHDNHHHDSHHHDHQGAALNQILRELSEIRQHSQQSRQGHDNIPASNHKEGNSNDTILSEIISSINEMKEDIKIAKSLTFQNVPEPTQRQGVASLPEQSTAQLSGTVPVVASTVLQQPSNIAAQVNDLNNILTANALQQGINGLNGLNSLNGLNGLAAATQPVNPYLNLLQGQRTLEAISQSLGRNPGISQPQISHQGMQPLVRHPGMIQPQVPHPGMVQPPVPHPGMVQPPVPHPFMGVPPGMLPNRMPPPFPPPFIPPGMPPPNPCAARTVVMNNINLCNGNTFPQRPLTPREIELCQSLQAATQCQNGNNCRAIPPHLYNYYCNGK